MAPVYLLRHLSRNHVVGQPHAEEGLIEEGTEGISECVPPAAHSEAECGSYFQDGRFLLLKRGLFSWEENALGLAELV